MPTQPTTAKPAADPLIEAKLDRALAPCADLFPPEVLAEFRETLTDFMTTHPAMTRMLSRLRPRPAVQVSVEQPTENAPPDAEAAPMASGSRR
jgi:hypothetical protein